MHTMTAAVLYGANDVRIEERPIPEVGPGEVLVRIDRALTCGTDVKVFKRGYHAKMIQPPALFGHEWAGVVDEVGDGVSGFQPGDRVVGANSAPCDECFFCRRGQQELCEDLLFLNGAYAQFIKVPARIVEKNLLHVPDSLSLRDAALVEPLACVVKGVEDSGIHAEDTVAVLGVGAIGLMFAAVALHCGARVISVGGFYGRPIADEMGAKVIYRSDRMNIVEAVLDLTESRRGADVVVEAYGVPKMWEAAIALVRHGGTVNLFGGCPADTKIDLATTRMHYGELTLKASFHHTPEHVRKALNLLTRRSIRTDLLITEEAPLAELPYLLNGGLLERRCVKVAIDPWL